MWRPLKFLLFLSLALNAVGQATLPSTPFTRNFLRSINDLDAIGRLGLSTNMTLVFTNYQPANLALSNLATYTTTGYTNALATKVHLTNHVSGVTNPLTTLVHLTNHVNGVTNPLATTASVSNTVNALASNSVVVVAGSNSTVVVSNTANRMFYVVSSTATGGGAGDLGTNLTVYSQLYAGAKALIHRTNKTFVSFTLGQAFTNAQSGDVIELLPGTNTIAICQVTNATIPTFPANELHLRRLTDVKVMGRPDAVFTHTNYGCVMLIESCTNLMLNGVNIIGPTNAMTLMEESTNTIGTNAVGAALVSIRGTNQDLTIENGRFWNAADQGIIVNQYSNPGERTRGLVVKGNHFRNIGTTNTLWMGSADVWWDGTAVAFNKAEDVLVINNKSDGWMVYFVEAFHYGTIGEVSPCGKNIAVVGNVIDGLLNSGVFTIDAVGDTTATSRWDSVVVTGNTFEFAPNSPIPNASAVHVLGSVVNVTVNGNSFRNFRTANANSTVFFLEGNYNNIGQTNITICGNTIFNCETGVKIVDARHSLNGNANEAISRIVISGNVFDHLHSFGSFSGDDVIVSDNIVSWGDHTEARWNMYLWGQGNGDISLYGNAGLVNAAFRGNRFTALGSNAYKPIYAKGAITNVTFEGYNVNGQVVPEFATAASTNAQLVVSGRAPFLSFIRDEVGGDVGATEPVWTQLLSGDTASFTFPTPGLWPGAIMGVQNASGVTVNLTNSDMTTISNGANALFISDGIAWRTAVTATGGGAVGNWQYGSAILTNWSALDTNAVGRLAATQAWTGSNTWTGNGYWTGNHYHSGSNNFAGPVTFSGTGSTIYFDTNVAFGAALIASNNSHGTVGQILYSQGSNAAPRWADAPTGGGGGTNSGPITLLATSFSNTNVGVNAITPLGCVTNGILPYRLTMTNNFFLVNPSNALDGQRITVEFVQDGTGSRLAFFDSKYAFGTDITGVTLSTTASKTDFATFIYNATADKWRCVGFVRGY